MEKLVTTPQLQMAIKMLSMSLDELLGEVDRLRKENPLLSIQMRTSRPIGPFPPDLETLPEVYVYLRGGDVFVEANVNAMPDIFVGNKLVPSIEEENDGTNDLVAQFPDDQKDHARSAAWIARAVQQRAKTYVKIVREIAGRAPMWFKDEYADPPAGTMRDVAEAVGMHESTITRVLGGDKVLRCERGLVKLADLIGSKKKEGYRL
jgi:RNA polymerase sigma-54 factor